MLAIIIGIIVIMVKFFIRYVHEDMAISVMLLLMILVFAACEIIEINVNTYGIIGSDFNWHLPRAHQERFMILQLRWRFEGVSYRVRFQRNPLTVVVQDLMSCNVSIANSINLIENFVAWFQFIATMRCLPLTVIRKLHLADNPSCVVATYVMGWTPGPNRCPGTFDLNICLIGCLHSNVASCQ